MPLSLRDYDAPISHTSEGNVEFSRYIRFDGSSPTTSNLDRKHFGHMIKCSFHPSCQASATAGPDRDNIPTKL